LLVDTPGLANGLLDVACAPESRRAASALSDVLTLNLTETLGASSASSTGYGTALRPPAVGRTLRVTRAVKDAYTGLKTLVQRHLRGAHGVQIGDGNTMHNTF
jgi:hypothetical protein